MKSIIFSFLFFLSLIQNGKMFSGGAGKDACLSMIPGHSGFKSQSLRSPFVLFVNETIIPESQSKIVLELKSTTSDKIKGFFIQGRDAENNNIIGTFSKKSYMLRNCSNGKENAITHASSIPKDNIVVEWMPPPNYGGQVIFRATVVKDFQTFWTNIESQKVEIQKRSASGVTNKKNAAQTENVYSNNQPQIQEMDVASDLRVLYEGCGATKTCIGFPNKCVNNKKCDYMVTFSAAESSMYEFELKGKGGGNRYVAVGLSFDDIMGNDAALVCGSTSDSVDVFMTWNDGKSNQNVLKPSEGIKKIVSSDADGTLYCRFRINSKLEPKKTKIFDLENEKFHILLAIGDLSEDKVLAYHGRTNKIVSADAVSIGQTSKVIQRDTRFFKMIHGSLMIGAWIGTASCGIIFARYFKQTWLGYKCCNLDQWFHFHRLFMVTTWSASIAALVLIVYELKEFRVTDHSLIGIVSFSLCFLQPFMAALRPHPAASGRSFFNWAHWFVGNSAQILGIAAIFFGYEMLLGEERNWVKEIAWYILVAFIIFHCVVHLILSITQCCSDKAPKATDVFPMKDFSGARGAMMTDRDEDIRRDAPYGCFRKFILSLYLPINWIVTAVLILAVVFTREQIEDQFIEWKVPAFWEDF